jgi:predicted Ser/Thr protein kinase
MRQYIIYYEGSRNKKNPHNLVNNDNELFNGTKKDARKHAAERKKYLKANDLVTGRIKVTIR